MIEPKNLKEALEFVDFPVLRKPLFYRLQGEMKEIEAQALVRTDQGVCFGPVSGQFKIVSHGKALRLAHEAMKKLAAPYALTRLALDKEGGARMFATFQVGKPEKIYEEGDFDEVFAELVLVNSYKGVSFGFELGSFRPLTQTSAVLPAAQAQLKWAHSKQVLTVDRVIGAARQGVAIFSGSLVSHYRQMARHSLTDNSAIAVAIISSVALPEKLRATAVRLSSATFPPGKGYSMWSVYNAMLRAVDSDSMSPSRSRELKQKVAMLFQLGGSDLVDKASRIPDWEIGKWKDEKLAVDTKSYIEG